MALSSASISYQPTRYLVGSGSSYAPPDRGERAAAPGGVDSICCEAPDPARRWFSQPPPLRSHALTKPAHQTTLATRVLRALDDESTREAITRGYHLPREYVTGYYERRIFPYQDRPDFLPDNEANRYHRGMYLTLDELRNIFVHGLEVARTSWHVGGADGVSFSTSQEEAITYIFQSPRSANGIGVVFVVRDDEQIVPCPESDTNPGGTIYFSPADVPTDKIVDVCLWGRWGLERIDDVLARIASNEIVPHTDWTGVFNR